MDNKKLIDTISRKLGRDKGDVGKLLDALTGIIAARCGEMDTVIIPGFGSFEPHKHAEFVTEEHGKRTLHPPRVTLDFKVSAVMRNKLKKQ